MRQLASYSMETTPAEKVSRENILEITEDWLGQKGEIAADRKSVLLNGGRKAEIDRSTLECTLGGIDRITLSEPTDSGTFVTSIEVAETADLLVLSVLLAAVSTNLTPQWLDIRRPKVILRAFEIPAIWSFRATYLTDKPIRFVGASGGDAFIESVWNDQRSVPVVAVSTEHGLELHPQIASDLASDLAGLAIVAQLTEEASWRLTSQKEKVWSCYGGAIRIYWPGIDPNSSPFVHHKLWTPRKLLLDVDSTEDAARRIRSHLRYTILGQSAFGVQQHSAFSEIRRKARQEELELLRSKATSEADYRKIAEEFGDQLVDLQEVNSKLQQENARLNAHVTNLELSLRYKEGFNDGDVESLEPATEAPPATVEDAVLMACEQFADTLIFGKDAYEGITTLSPDAGPPDKILFYLRSLSELTEARRLGAIGTSVTKWLQERGVICSGESETTANSRTEMNARRWDDGCGNIRQFEQHLKPKDGTSPDQCVRIYFVLDDNKGPTVIGWVGRHPGT